MGQKFAANETRIATVEHREADLREQVDALRRAYGLPVESMKEKLLRRGVPEVFHALLLDGKLEPTQALTLVEELLAGNGRLLIMSGKAGCGKSQAAGFALSRRSGLWVHAPDLARPQPKEEVESGNVLEERMRAAGLLVLDDVGLEHSPGGFAAARIADVLVHREAARRPTIVTTNLSGDEFAAKYGDDRMRSRLDGDPLGWQTVVGPDLRSELSGATGKIAAFPSQMRSQAHVEKQVNDAEPTRAEREALQQFTATEPLSEATP